MIKRWIVYFGFLALWLCFFAAYQGQIAWLLLVITAAVPWLSLILSIAPMLLIRPRYGGPGVLTIGASEMLTVVISSRIPLPLPPCQCRFTVTHMLTNTTYKLRSGDYLPTDHCGTLLCQCARFYVFDYMGMFRFPLPRMGDRRIIIRPENVTVPVPKSLDRFLSRSFQPKLGGGFAENHDLRLYRPGDNLNQVHWKLSAKTGKLIIREPLVPRYGLVVLSLDLNGSAWEMDRKLARLPAHGRHLLDRSLVFEIHAHTASGLVKLPVATHEDLLKALDHLLACAPATSGSVLDSRILASWRYHIGGERHET